MNPAPRTQPTNPIRAGLAGACAVVVAVAVALVSTLTGCGGTSSGAVTGTSASGVTSTRSGGTMDPLQQLQARPTFEQAERDYLALLDQIRAAVSAAVPSLTWRTPKAIRFNQAMCAAPFTDIPGTNNANYDGGYTKGNIPDDVWPTLSRTVIDLAARYGFTHVIRLADKPGSHTLVIWDDHDAHLELGTLAAATLTLYGGCFLTAAAHPSAAPATQSGDTTLP